MMSNKNILRGDVISVNLEPAIGSEQKGVSRPCVVVQNNRGNRTANTTIIVPLTDAEGKKVYPFQAFVQKGVGGMTKDSIARCEQIRTIDQSRIINMMGHLDENTIIRINSALRRSLEL